MLSTFHFKVLKNASVPFIKSLNSVLVVPHILEVRKGMMHHATFDTMDIQIGLK